MDGGAWWDAVHGVTKSRVRLLVTPGTGEPGGLPSMGSHRVGHDQSNLAEAAAVVKINHSSFPFN